MKMLKIIGVVALGMLAAHFGNAQTNLWTDNGTDIFTSPFGTKVGIGTIPVTELHIKQTQGLVPTCGTVLRLEYDFPGPVNGCPAMGQSIWDIKSTTTGTFARLDFETPSIGPMVTMLDNGNVGINTTAPQTAVHIKREGGIVNYEGATHVFTQWYPNGFVSGRKGKLGFTVENPRDFTVRNENKGSHILLLTDSGAVGVKTATPRSDYEAPGRLALDVRGDGRFGHIEDRYVRLGYNGTNGIIDLFSDEADDALLINYYSGRDVVMGGGPNGGSDLYVNGTVNSCEVLVTPSTFCDFVFDEDHRRMTPDERRLFYKTEKHLPMVAPEDEILTNGLGVGHTLKGFAFNLEEFGLNQLDLYDGQEELKQKVQEQEETIDELERRLMELEAKLALMNK